MARFGDVFTAMIGIPPACYAGWRAWIIVHILGHLRLRRITPPRLHEKIMSGEQFAIIFLLSFEEEPENTLAFLELFGRPQHDSAVHRR